MTETIFIWAISISVMLPSALIDRKTHTIPNLLSLGGSAAALAFRFIFLRDNGPLFFLFSGIYGGAVFLLIERILRGKLGIGDVKLSFFMGICLGFWGWHISVFTASLSGIIMYILKYKKRDKEKQIAFAPFLCLGSCTALVLITLKVIPLPV